MKFPKWLKRIAFALAALATLVVLALAIENYRGKRAWDRCRRALEAQGEVLDWKQFIPPPVPDDQNFARTALLQPLAGFGRKAGGQSARPSDDATARLQALLDWPTRALTHSSWREGQFLDAGEARRALREQTNNANDTVREWLKTPPAEPVADLLALLRLNQAELDELHAALQRPTARFDIRYEESIAMLLPHLSVLRNFARAFALRAQLHLEAGDAAAALADVEDTLALARTLETEPILISALVRFATLESAIQPVWQGLARRQWQADQLAALQARFARLNLVADASRAMRGERAFSLAAMAYLRDQPPGVALGEGDAGTARALRWWLTGWVDQNRVAIARMFQDSLLPAYDVTNRVVSLAAARADWRRVEEELKTFSPYKIFARLLLPALGKVTERTARVQAAVDLVVVACALERFQQQHGAYPERLEQLTPEFLARLPLDPVSGELLRYRPDGEGRFVLWSVGANLKDDQATPERPRKSGAAETEPQGDWVWRYPGK